MREVVLGIDTSNYTTSLAILTREGDLIANIKRPLAVKAGERGLRQSDALFQHVKNIPDVMREAEKYLCDSKIVAIGVSTRPRNVDGSYMPCFLAGVAQAESISKASGAALYEFSHQCGHIMAGIYSSGNFELLNKPFLGFHVSGGTTEMLRVSFNGRAFDTTLLGGTADLNAGQLIDRIGVYMGLSFPCGREMEFLARECDKPTKAKRLKVNDYKINLSGLENLAVKMYDDTGDKSYVSSFIFNSVAEGLIALADAYFENNTKSPVLFSGGVMSNGIIKEKIKKKYEAYFAEPALSADNAVGIAYLALKASV